MNPHFPVISLQIIRGAIAAELDGFLEEYIDKVLVQGNLSTLNVLGSAMILMAFLMVLGVFLRFPVLAFFFALPGGSIMIGPAIKIAKKLGVEMMPSAFR